MTSVKDCRHLAHAKFTPFSTFADPYVMSCADDLTGVGDECGSFSAGLANATAFKGPVATQLLHEYAVLGESHGCLRAGRDAAVFVHDAYVLGLSVAVVVLDRRTS